MPRGLGGGFGGGLKAPKSMGVKGGSKAMGVSDRGDRKRPMAKSPRATSRKVDKEEEMELESPEDIFGNTTPDGQEKDGGLFSAIGDIGSAGPAVSMRFYLFIKLNYPLISKLALPYCNTACGALRLMFSGHRHFTWGAIV